jgi:site-specific recombinase XerD
LGVYKRNGSNNYHIDFVFRGQRFQRSAWTSNRRAAETIEAKWKIDLATGAVGIKAKPLAPTLKEFSDKFNKYVEIRNEAKPKTVEFYKQQMARLLDFRPLSKRRLSDIDEALIERFVHHRLEEGVKISTVNRGLATLRKLLRLADEWRLIDRVPRVRLLTGEQNRTFVLGHKEEKIYLDFAPQPLTDVATLLIDTGLRVGEALALQKADVTLTADGDEKHGSVYVREGKSKHARRHVAITGRVKGILKERISAAKGAPVFCDPEGNQLLVTSLDHLHSQARTTLKLPKEFVLHSLRHTFLTRLGDAGADAFVIMKTAGHHAITVSQAYVHPNHEAVEAAVARMEILNKEAAKKLANLERSS